MFIVLLCEMKSLNIICSEINKPEAEVRKKVIRVMVSNTLVDSCDVCRFAGIFFFSLKD